MFCSQDLLGNYRNQSCPQKLVELPGQAPLLTRQVFYSHEVHWLKGCDRQSPLQTQTQVVGAQVTMKRCRVDMITTAAMLCCDDRARSTEQQVERSQYSYLLITRRSLKLCD